MTIDRKELTRQYKATPRTMGVAVVRHLATGKVFLFAGLDINALINRYRLQLRTGSHPSQELQRDWRRDGESAFAFEVLDSMVPKDSPDVQPADELALLEQIWLDRLRPFPPAGYNRPPKP